MSFIRMEENFSVEIEACGETSLLAKRYRSNCPCCKSTDYDIVFQGYDDRLGYADIFNIAVCRVCSYGFIEDPIKIELIPQLYQQCYPKFPKYSQFPSLGKGLRARIESKMWFNYLEGSPELSALIKCGESVLDVGCSYGATATIVTGRGGAWTGIEIDLRCCEYLKSRGLRYYKGSIEQFAEISKERFDTIIFSQVLEHLYDPLSALGAARRILTDNGRILLSMPNYESRYKRRYGTLWLHWHIPYHVGQWSKKSLNFACEEVGLRIHRFSTVTFFAWWRVQRAFKAAKQGEPNPSYAKGALPRWMHRTGLAILYHLFVDVYLRILDGFGGGDIIIAELKVNKG